MAKKNKIQKIKNFIKVCVALGLLLLFIVLAFFVKHKRTFENANMDKWISLDADQRTDTMQRIIPDFENNDLFMNCMNKIASLPESENMMIQSAAALCYNGIKIIETNNTNTENQ